MRSQVGEIKETHTDEVPTQAAQQLLEYEYQPQEE